MSSFNLVYKKYDSVSSLAGDLNDSVIILKRRKLSSSPDNIKKAPNLDVTNDELKNANKLIKNALSKLERINDSQTDKSSKSKQSNIRKIVKKIDAHKKLSDKDFSIIDSYISELDNEASDLFKKLRTSGNE